MTMAIFTVETSFYDKRVKLPPSVFKLQAHCREKEFGILFSFIRWMDVFFQTLQQQKANG